MRQYYLFARPDSWKWISFSLWISIIDLCISSVNGRGSIHSYIKFSRWCLTLLVIKSIWNSRACMACNIQAPLSRAYIPRVLVCPFALYPLIYYCVCIKSLYAKKRVIWHIRMENLDRIGNFWNLFQIDRHTKNKPLYENNVEFLEFKKGHRSAITVWRINLLRSVWTT